MFIVCLKLYLMFYCFKTIFSAIKHKFKKCCIEQYETVIYRLRLHICGRKSISKKIEPVPEEVLQLCHRTLKTVFPHTFSINSQLLKKKLCKLSLWNSD